MKTLIIFRHAEAEETPPGKSDSERTLTEKGRGQATRQGNFLRQAGMVPEKVIASSALRAIQTGEALGAVGGASGSVEPLDELYNVPGDALLEVVRGLPEGIGTLAMVAHMPGVGELLSLLTTEHVDLDHVFSPATMAAVRVDGDSWRDVDYGVGALTLFLPPLLPPP